MSYLSRSYEVRAKYDGEQVQAEFSGYQPASMADEEPAGVEGVSRTSLTILGVDITDAQVRAFPERLRKAIEALEHEVEFEGL